MPASGRALPGGLDTWCLRAWWPYRSAVSNLRLHLSSQSGGTDLELGFGYDHGAFVLVLSGPLREQLAVSSLATQGVQLAVSVVASGYNLWGDVWLYKGLVQDSQQTAVALLSTGFSSASGVAG